MNKLQNIFVLTALFLYSGTLKAQPGFSVQSVDFGDVVVNQKATQNFKIYASSGGAEIKLHLSDTFFKSNISNYFLNPFDSVEVTLSFNPGQNISYKGVLLISSNFSPGQRIIPVNGKGKLALSYYDATFDLYDEALKSVLKQITGQNYVSLGYNSARDQMYANLDNVGGNVTCVYTGRKAQFNTRSGATSNNFNCEHTWPQSMFGQNEPMRSDIHHLYSTDETANGKRDNDPFGVVSSPTWSVGGSKWSNNVFEPRDEQKGNSARSMFYMAIRYQNYTNFLDGQENTLRQWNSQFPPDNIALKRNGDIYQLQKNRNPFVDHPAFADRMISISKTANRTAFPRYFHTSQLNHVSELVTFNRKTGDTVSVFFWNNGTADWILDSISPPLNAKWLGVSATIQPGTFYAISFVETDTRPMGQSYSIHLRGKTINDTLRFIQSTAGNEFNSQVQIEIYPNPVISGVLKIMGLKTTGNIEIYDALGKRALFTDISPDLNEIDIQHLNNGIYFVRILNEGKERTSKVVIQK